MDALHNAGWRLELVLADDLVLPNASPEAIAAQLQEAVELAETGHGTAALLLAWTAVDEVLRGLASTFAPSESGRRVLTADRAYSLGLLSDSQHRMLSGIQRLRNEVAHTIRPVEATPQLIADIAALVSRMARPSYVPPPIMADRALAELDQDQDPLQQTRRLSPESALEEQLEAADYIRALRPDDESKTFP